MIKIIAGAKGSGKTKHLIDQANKDAKTIKGVSCFITDTTRYMYDIKRPVRFINVKDYNITGEDALCGFVKGIAAGNHDYEYMYIDGVARICGKSVSELSTLFYMLEKLSNDNEIAITMTCSCAVEELPPFAQKYV